ncbi:MAG: 16S rRNA (cytosine(1402)-N(4))-methyltransferase RsmH [Verrucomicrobiota bacterium]
MLTTPSILAFDANRSAAAWAMARVGPPAVADRRYNAATDCRYNAATDRNAFLAGRKMALGTELLLLFKTMVRAATGWLSARPSEFFLAGRSKALGTVLATANHSPTARTVPGWSVRRSANFTTAAATAADDYHLPVFPAEVATWMAAGPESFIIDGTLGGGGHSEIFLTTGARVLGIDRDPEALAHARERLARFGTRFATWEGNFSQVLECPALQQGERADGLLLDLGVSSRQLDSAARGFSFMREGPLDMRMGPSSVRTAADIINGWAEAELARLLFDVGEEHKARRIAAAIVKRRAERPFQTTTELAECIEQAVGRHGRIHPATRTFQAIRMTVNEELESLTAALHAAPQVLKPGGCLLVITFHSLEDRLVKQFLRHHSAPFIDDPGWPAPRPNPECWFRLLARKAIAPSLAETSLNPRSRSAKLRVAQLLDPMP